MQIVAFGDKADIEIFYVKVFNGGAINIAEKPGVGIRHAFNKFVSVPPLYGQIGDGMAVPVKNASERIGVVASYGRPVLPLQIQIFF